MGNVYAETLTRFLFLVVLHPGAFRDDVLVAALVDDARADLALVALLSEAPADFIEGGSFSG